MKTLLIYSYAIVACLLLVPAHADETGARDDYRVGQPPPNDRFPLVPLEVLISFNETLEISEQQLDKFRDHMAKNRRELQQLNQRLRSEMRAMHDILSANPIDAKAARRQLDKVLQQEAQIKQLRVGGLVWLNNQLTAEQLATARTLHEDVRDGRVQRRMRSMVRRVQRAARAMADRGTPPVEVKRRMQEVEALIDAGKVEEAEAMLRKILSYVENQ
ncbi:MAG: periplasmic heavy metal sensor [Gammaproteobacteria bacterium]|nr:periplasmic heavy metal sensor [Gammaproteobacteria bacterium]